jgi:hypothetical protein
MALKAVMQNDRDFTELRLLYLILMVFNLILRVPDLILMVLDLTLRVLECIVTTSFGVYLALWLF